MSAAADPQSTRYKSVSYEYTRMSVDKQLATSRRFLATMVKRRTIRNYSSEPVPYELIENAIRAASLVPSGANQQPWTFVVISNPELKRRIRLAAEAEEKKSYEHRMSREWLEALEILGTDWHKPHIEQAPYIIVVFAQHFGLVIRPDGTQRKVKHYYVQESVGIAVGILLSSLAHAGLATLTHTPSPMSFLREILQRPANEHAYVLIPVGYPAPGATVPAITKKSLDEVLVHFG